MKIDTSTSSVQALRGFISEPPKKIRNQVMSLRAQRSNLGKTRFLCILIYILGNNLCCVKLYSDYILIAMYLSKG